MKTVLSLLILCWFLPGSADAQYASMLHRPYKERMEVVRKLHRELVDQHMDWAAVADTLAGMRALASKHQDTELRMEADLIEIWYHYTHTLRDPAGLKALLHESEQAGIANIACRTAYLISIHYWYTPEYEQAFRWFLRLDEMIRGLSIDELPDKASMYIQIGNAYYHFGDFEPAIDYFKQVVQLPIQDFDIQSWRHAWNTMGLAYRRLGDLAASDSCFRTIISQADKHAPQWGDQALTHPATGQSTPAGKSEEWSGIASGNLARNLYMRGDYKEAIRLYDHDIRIAEKYDTPGLIIGAATSLADIYLIQGNLSLSKTYLDQAYRLIRELQQTDALHRLHPIMSKWYMASGNSHLAAAYLDSALVAKEHFDNKFSSLQLMRAQQEVQAGRQEASLMQLQAESARQIGQRNLILSGLVILVLGISFWIYRQRKTSELRLKERDLRLLAADKELQEAREQLEAFARTVTENNRKLESLSQSGTSGSDGELIEQLAGQVILTDEDWDRFSNLFGKVYPGFHHRLKSQYPTLTPAEIRCLSMEKLHFSNKEMGAMQGISPNSVMVTKHRIRKKIGLSKTDSLHDFMQSI